MSDKLKQLTGKNPKEFEPVAYSLINNADTELFKDLVDGDDFLFDFVKHNVINRLQKVVNAQNYQNLVKFLKFYSPTYENFIAETFVKFADENFTNNMLKIFEQGTEEEKTYCAKFFTISKNKNALELLRKYAYSENVALSTNCVEALSKLGDREIFNHAMKKLNSDDDFEQLEGARLLVSYGDKSAFPAIIEVMKYSSMAENIAAELPYLVSLFEMSLQDRLFVLNTIIDGLGEIIALSQVFDFCLYEVFEEILAHQINSQAAVVLLNAKEKFNTLTENEEYLYDETKDVKQEISDIKLLLTSARNLNPDEELKADSLFVYSALEFTSNIQKVRQLLSSDNQTVVMKALEVLKRLNSLTAQDKSDALEVVSDENLINVIMAI